MSHKITPNFTPLKVDIFTPQENSSASANSPWQFGPSLPSVQNTDVVVSGANYVDITLYTGSSYYLEGAPQADNAGGNGNISWQWYDVTNAQWIGSDAFDYTAGAGGASTRQCRKACTALVLDSDITGASIVVQLRIKSIAGTGWTFTISTPTLGLPSSVYGHTGYPSARIWQLPT